MIVSIQCRICKENKEITVQESDLNKYHNGMKVQHAFPYLTAAEREMFITQYCGKCWNEIINESEG